MRQHSRVTFRPANRMQVLERSSGEPLGLVVDLSVGGLGIFTDTPLDVGGRYELSLEVPVRAGRFRYVDIAVICQWSRRNGRVGRFEQGFALVEPAPAFVDLVNSLKDSQGLSRSLKV